MRWLVVVMFVVGCAGTRKGVDRPPAGAVQSWADAVAKDDPRAAYDLLAASVKKDMPYESFAQRWRESRPERERQSAALKATLREDPRLGERGKLLLSDGKVVQLVHEADGWRMETPLLSGARAASPQDALRLLAAAVETHSWDGVMRLMTSTRRDAFRDLAEQFSKGLKQHIAEGIEIQGDRAKIQWTDGKRTWKVILKKEEGEWRVDDFDVR